MPKWEYKSLALNNNISYWSGKTKNEEEFVGELNKFGEDGWELVGVFTSGTTSAMFVHFILKRQVNE